MRDVLAQRVKDARRKKFRTVDGARVAAQVARGTWEKVEKGEPVKDFSLAAIESALGWESGTAASILEGVDPQRRGLSVVLGEDPTPRPRPRRRGIDGYLEHLEDRIDALEARVARLDGMRVVIKSDVDDDVAAAAKKGSIEDPGETTY